MFGVKTGSEAIYVLGHFTFFLKTALVKEGHRGMGVLMLQMSTLLLCEPCRLSVAKHTCRILRRIVLNGRQICLFYVEK